MKRAEAIIFLIMLVEIYAMLILWGYIAYIAVNQPNICLNNEHEIETFSKPSMRGDHYRSILEVAMEPCRTLMA